MQRSLEGGLGTCCADARLSDLTILQVEPLHGSGAHLLVVVAAPDADPALMGELEATLQNAAGLFRAVVATEIRRKRTPHLTFRVVPELQ